LIRQIQPDRTEVRFDYDLYNRIIKQTLTNGVYTTFEYDVMGNILETKTYNSESKLLQKESHTFDTLGRNISNTRFV
jgi:YD repeat-containing protein